MAIAISTAMLAWCSNSSTQWQANWPKVVNIGVIAPISGPASSYGLDGVNTYKYLTDKFNKEHTDIQIKLIVEDGKCEGKDAASAAQKLISVDNVVAIMWWSCSAEAMESAKIAQSNHVVLMDSVASDPAISDVGDYVFKYINDVYAGKKLADYASQNYTSINLIYDNNDYGVALANVIRANYTWTIVSEIKVQVNEKDLSLVAKKIKQSPSEWLIVIDQDDVHAINKIKAFNKEWLFPKYTWKILSAYWYSSDTVLSQVNTLLSGSHQVDVPGVELLWSAAQQFVNDYKKTNQILLVPSYIVFQGESMNTILDAIKSGNYDSESIHTYLKSITAEHQRNGLFWSYYFSGSDAIGINYVIQKVQSGAVVAIQ